MESITRVRAAYAVRHPDRQVVAVCEDRRIALRLTAAAPGRMVDLSYGFYIVTAPLEQVGEEVNA